MLELIFVRASVWLAVVCWFAGAMLRAAARRQAACGRWYPRVWLVGAVLLVVHIAASYGWVHRWSHAAALRDTAEQSERVTGIRAAWGVYVNFLFSALWLVYSGLLARREFCLRPGRWRQRFDRTFFWFSCLIVFSATVVFEPGPVRWLSAAGFLALAILEFRTGGTRLGTAGGE
jgi:hypothetical protein